MTMLSLKNSNKLSLYHLESLTLHVELKISHFPIVHDSISTKMLTINSEFMKQGLLTGVKRITILKIYESSFYLLSRKYKAQGNCYPEKTEVTRVYKNPLNILKNFGFFNQIPTGCNFHYKFIKGNEEIQGDLCGSDYEFQDSEDIYTECKIADGIPIDK